MPYMGFNFAFYETGKLFMKFKKPDSSLPSGKEERTLSLADKEAEKLDNIIVQDSQKLTGTLSKLLRDTQEVLINGLCGGFAGGASKFLVYPLVSYSKMACFIKILPLLLQILLYFYSNSNVSVNLLD